MPNKLEKVKDMYYNKKMTLKAISEEFGVCRTTVGRWLRKDDKERYESNSPYTSSRLEADEKKASALVWITLFEEGKKIEKIAKESGYSHVFVRSVLKKYQAERLEDEWQRRRYKRKHKNKKNLEAQMIEANIKIEHEAACRELSVTSKLSDYSMFQACRSLYERVKPGLYKVKKNLTFALPSDVPRRFISEIERESYKACCFI